MVTDEELKIKEAEAMLDAMDKAAKSVSDDIKNQIDGNENKKSKVDEKQDKRNKLIRRYIKGNPSIDEELKGGMMNEAFVVKTSNSDQKYILYLPTAQANEMVDRKIERKAHNIAYKLGISNKTIHFDIKKGIKIFEYIDGSSINKEESEEDFAKVAELFVKLHASKKTTGVYYDPLGRLNAYRREAEVFVKKFDKEFYELFDFVMKYKSFLRDQYITLAHNDAQRSNIVRRTDGKYFLIDYEFAADNDPVYDIATFGNNRVEDGLKLLEEYEKLVPLENGLKRYALWRIDVSLQWYLVAIIKHHRGEGAVHGFNFLDVAHSFLENAKEARKLLK